jgi:aminobenzoyl-glutamate utilization protein B
MNVGINYLREHIISDARIHYVILNGGGLAPNVVPAFAESFYMIRAPKLDQLKAIYGRVIDVAKGAALMTGTEVEIAFHAGASNVVLNDTIADLLRIKLNAISSPAFSDEERQFARELQDTFPEDPGMIERMAKRYGPKVIPMLDGIEEQLLFEGVLPADKQETTMHGSTDVGDVSWVVPTGQINTTCHAVGTPGHSWQSVAQAGTSIGHKGMLYAAQVLAASALAFMGDSDLLQQARDEFVRRTQDTPFESPIPDGATPPVTLRP